MQYGLDGPPTRRALRRLSLAFMPALAVAAFLPLLIFAANPPGVAIATVSLAGGRVLHRYLLDRSA